MVVSPYGLYCFKVIGKVLDKSLEIEAVQKGLDLETVGTEIFESIEQIRSEYYSNAIPVIPFQDLRLRQAYLYWAAPVNALAFKSAIDGDASIRELILQRLRNKGVLRVCCIGGGPGSEVFGLAKWTERNFSGPAEIDVLVTDKFVEWRSIWRMLRDEINQGFSEHYSDTSTLQIPKINNDFSQVDVLVQNHSGRVKTRGSFDIYVFSYLASHIFSHPHLQRFNDFVKQVSSSARHDSMFIFMDRSAESETWKSPIKELAEASGLKLSDYGTVSVDQHDNLEKQRDLGTLYKKVGSCTALSRDAFWVAGRKV